MNGPDKKQCSNVLIVEDDKSIQEILKESLEMEGYTVFTADNGQVGLEMLPTLPTPCLILLDLMMPVMNGWQFAENISKDMTLAAIPIVLVTAFEDRAKLIPSKGIIKKPIDLDLLLNTVQHWCNGISDKGHVHES
jgi:CheY-like chemotaxis protein